MFNASLTATTGAMRPGLISGKYPEQKESFDGWLDRSFKSLCTWLSRLRIDRSTPLKNVAQAIGQKATLLTKLNRNQLDQLVIDLRHRLHHRAMDDEQLNILAFALVREMALRTLGTRPYDSQLMAGWVMLHGNLAEMQTGEGKTLAAALAAATAALAGVPVHVITANEYLVKRDAEKLAPLYKALGLTIGYVDQTMQPGQLRKQYACDITYCTSQQAAFDYLRDRVVLGNERSQLRLQLEGAYASQSRLDQLLLRGLCFAIIDEADSVLIDEARTPLILTRSIDSSTEHELYRQALAVARTLEQGQQFYLDHTTGKVQLSLTGQQILNHFKDCNVKLWQNARMREEIILKALQAMYLLQKDRDYLVIDQKVVIIDANTGRTMPDRSWEKGLHQLVEAKENCPMTETREQLARLSFQSFFRRYMHLGGMTGTAREVSAELWPVYGLRVQRIPLHRPSQCLSLPVQVYPQMKDKYKAVIAAVKAIRKKGRPVLIGTDSVGAAEQLSRILNKKRIPHCVLNARQDKNEAQIIASAGQPGQVTVATNMAGRGTDIALGPGVAALGGLHVIAACRNEAGRIDRQLYGRCARMGDPGSYQVIVSLEDDLIRNTCHPLLIKFLQNRTAKKGLLQQKLNQYFIKKSQQKIEKRHYRARRAMLQHGKHTGRLLAFSGNME
ncbi:MAG: prepilin peptidase [Desulfobacteraceae bacterium]|nr:prepilin peptidase [Desulfobacteraceae bacterium]